MMVNRGEGEGFMKLHPTGRRGAFGLNQFHETQLRLNDVFGCSSTSPPNSVPLAMKANPATRLLPHLHVRAFLALGAVLISAGSAYAGSGASPDDVARFMAGLPPKAESPVPLTQTPAWQHHARVFSSAWARPEQRQPPASAPGRART